VIRVVEKEFKQEAAKSRIKQLLNNSEKAISGKEILRLADKFGKGWFAIMISGEITPRTSIPTYILSALAFACPRLNEKIKESLIKKRLKSLSLPFPDDDFDYQGVYDQVLNVDILGGSVEQLFKSQLPDDSLTQFFDLINERD